MPRLNKVAIIGVGLLGGSVGLAIRSRRLARRVTGHFRKQHKIALAVARGAIDDGTLDLREAVRDADLIILATPVNDILDKLKLLRRIAPVQSLILDTGSTKVQIRRTGQGIKNFVGCHPLAGSEKAGLDAADPDLFVNAPCILTPGASTLALKKARAFWQALGCRIILMKADAHDRILSSTSHLPHAVAFALIASIDPKNAPFAAGGLRDTTRIAASHPEIWKDIFLSNRRDVLSSISLFEKELARLKTSLRRQDGQKLFKFLSNARAKRQRIFHP